MGGTGKINVSLSLSPPLKINKLKILKILLIECSGVKVNIFPAIYSFPADHIAKTLLPFDV